MQDDSKGYDHLVMVSVAMTINSKYLPGMDFYIVPLISVIMYSRGSKLELTNRWERGTSFEL